MKKIAYISLSLAILSGAFGGGKTALAGTLSLSQTNVQLYSGGTAQVTAYPNSGQSLYLAAVINTNAISASLSGNQVNITALSNGNGQVQVCSFDGNCGLINVNVGYGNNNYNYCNYPGCNYNYNYGTLSFDQNSLAMSFNQTRTVNIYGGAQSYYISSNSNSSAASASISGSQLNITTYNYTGSTTITVCVSNYGYNYGYYNYNNQGCGTVTVNVIGTPFMLTTQNLPDAVSGQYYNFQLQTSGGNYPYRYFVTSGALPVGLTMSTLGNITGTPQYYGNSTTATFTVQAYDSNNSSTSFNLTMRVNPYGYNNNNYNYNNQWNWYNQGQVLGASVYNNGTLVNDGGTVYIVYRNTKTPFANAAAFLGLGYQWSNVINGSTANLTSNGFVIASSSSAHPWGSWLRSGQTVYFVNQDGLIPVPSYEVFTSNGGNLSSVVDMNSYDLGKTFLPVMSHNDYRLH